VVEYYEDGRVRGTADNGSELLAPLQVLVGTEKIEIRQWGPEDVAWFRVSPQGWLECAVLASKAELPTLSGKKTFANGDTLKFDELGRVIEVGEPDNNCLDPEK
jgi:hypothetical protein